MLNDKVIQIDNNIIRSLCPLCSSHDIKKIGVLQYGAFPLRYSLFAVNLQKQPELWKCLNCKSLFANNILPEDTSRFLYAKAAGKLRWGGIPFINDKDKTTLKAITALFKNNDIKKILDIGCNTGEFLDFIKDGKIETYGAEYNDYARVVCEKKGHKIYTSLEDVDKTFDVITCFDLVEHLYNPKLFFEIVSNKLKSQGIAIIHTGDGSCLSSKLTGVNWWYVRYPEHIIFPSIYFFKSLPQFELLKVIKCYASNKHSHQAINKLSIMIKYFTKRYNGIPALSKDHNLIILKKSANK